MSKTKPSYHHGDLRLSLIATATQMIHEQGIDTLSMRKLADAVGVSRSAPYHHFRDKRELLCAIAEDGFHAQDHMLALLPDTDGRLRFEHLVQQYIRFATEHPQQYDLMYGREIWKKGAASPSLEASAKRSFKLWLDEIGKLQSDGEMPDNIPTLRLAQVSWATLHGLCRLLNDGIYVDTDNIEEMGRTAVNLLLQPSA